VAESFRGVAGSDFPVQPVEDKHNQYRSAQHPQRAEKPQTQGDRQIKSSHSQRVMQCAVFKIKETESTLLDGSWS
jgi:hypothetical protein